MKMENPPRMLWHAFYHHRAAPYLLVLLANLSLPTALAETITIGKGKGVLWEGMPFNVTMSGKMVSAKLDPIYGLLSISASATRCQVDTKLEKIAGYHALKVAPGVGLIPRASGNASYYKFSNTTPSTMSGTIGLPKTEGVNSDGTTLSNPSGYSWCLPPDMSIIENFYDPDLTRTSTLSGTWVLLADGSQSASEIIVPTMYAGSYSVFASGDRSTSILPSNITLRVSTLECTVSTPSSISFGPVARNLQAGAELGAQSNPLTVTCGQTSDFITANINLQFRPLSGLYQSAPGRLALREGGGYITGEIDNGVTSSGKCNATTGIPFDNSRLKIGQITQKQSSLNITNQVIWRLCSGGKDLPIGNVSAATEMLVTFN